MKEWGLYEVAEYATLTSVFQLVDEILNIPFRSGRTPHALKRSELKNAIDSCPSDGVYIILVGIQLMLTMSKAPPYPIH